MNEIKIKNQRIWFDESLLSEPAEHCFDPQFWQSNNRIIGSAKGRGTTWFIQLDKINGALRHYRRGGLFGKLVSDSYLFSEWEKTRSFQEFKLLEHLRAAEVNVPKPIAARAIKKGATYRADIISELIPNATDLISILKNKPLSKQQYQKVGQQILNMHAAGVNHTDLNIHNILLDANDKVWIIDFDKCYLQQGESWKQDNWNRLKRSFEKEKLKHDIHWSLKEFDYLFESK